MKDLCGQAFLRTQHLCPRTPKAPGKGPAGPAPKDDSHLTGGAPFSEALTIAVLSLFVSLFLFLTWGVR